MTATEVRLVGEGGVEWTFELPLSEPFANQVKAHALRPADDESAAELADLLVPAVDAVAEEVPAEPKQEPEPKPKQEPKQAPEPDGDKAPLDLEALGKMGLADLRAVAAEIGVDAETLASLEKPGTSKKSVIAAIVAADAQ